MNPIKKLAGQTAIYGVSSIVGRILNYLLVPLYTRIFTQAEFGTVSIMYAYVAVVFIILIYGMETTFFRYSETEANKNRVYNTVLSSLFLSTFIFISFAILLSGNISEWIQYPDHKNYVQWLAIILAMDAITAIPFARLRAQNRSIRFASIKFINIGINIGLNLFFLLLCPQLMKSSNDTILQLTSFVFNPELGIISYVFISNLVASSITIILLLPELFNYRFEFDYRLWRKMIVYSLPLLLTGLAGIMNETLGRFLIKYLLPQDIADQQVGIYAASLKIAILLNLFVQAFRYAAEPFFFSHEKEKGSKIVYARVMNYFVITTSLIFLGIMMYLDIIILMVGEDFREGIAVIPILLIAYLFLGIFYNLSVWYKLTNKTRFGAILAAGGAVITIVFNLLWIPKLGYIGSAWATLICYGAMMVASYFWGQKHFVVKYDVKKIIGYIGLAILLFLISKLLTSDVQILKLTIHTSLMLVYIFVVYFIEKKEINSTFFS